PRVNECGSKTCAKKAGASRTNGKVTATRSASSLLNPLARHAAARARGRWRARVCTAAPLPRYSRHTWGMALRIRPLLAFLVVAALAACKPAPDDGAASPATGPQGVGVVQAVDPAAGTIAIAHEAVEALGWPAMIMPFKVALPELLDGVTVGERIEFELERPEMTAPVTSLRKAR